MCDSVGWIVCFGQLCVCVLPIDEYLWLLVCRVECMLFGCMSCVFGLRVGVLSCVCVCVGVCWCGPHECVVTVLVWHCISAALCTTYNHSILYVVQKSTIIQ